MKKIILTLISCVVLAVVAWLLFSRTKPAAGTQKQAGGLPHLAEADGNPAKLAQHPVAGQKTTVTPQKPSVPAVTSKQGLTTQQVLSGMALSESIRTIAGLTPDKSYQTRTRAAHSLGRELSRKELDGIYAFLAARYEDYKGELQLLEFESIRNDTLDALLRQKDLPPDLGKQILKMYKDPGQNEVWRDYCVQHFGPYAQAKWKDGVGAGDDAEWAEITNAYWQATTETKTTIAGTALIGMNSLAGRYPGLTKDQVAERSLQLAGDDACGDASRVTAFRMCAQLGYTEVLPSARVVAQTGGSIHLRMAATATVGDLGDKSDIELLQSLAAGCEARIKPIAESGLKRLNARLAQGEQAAK